MKLTRRSQLAQSAENRLHKPTKRPALLSIIVPIYNAEPYLRRCLDSLCAQSYRNLEIICIDDGSTDATLSILREYEAADERFRVCSQPNSGVSSARNHGLELASGEWVTGVDADDYLMPEAYATAMKHATAEVDLVNFGVRVEAAPGEGMEGEVEAVRKYLGDGYSGVREMAPDIVYGVGWNIWNKLYRRSVIEKHGLRFGESMCMAEDQCFHMSFCAYIKKVAFCPSQLYVYILRKSSATFSNDKAEARLHSLLKALRKIVSVYNGRNLLESFSPLSAFLYGSSNWHILRWSLVTGQPLSWRAQLMEHVHQYRMQEYPLVEPVVRELAEQLRCAQRAVALLKSCAPESTPAEYRKEDELHVAIPTDEAHAGAAFLTARCFRKTALTGQAVCIHFLCDDVSPHTCSQLRELAGENLRVHLCLVAHKPLSQLPPLDDTFPHAGYLKMALPWLLPEVQRTLVLTPGILVRSKLPWVSKVDMEGKSVAVLADFPVDGCEEALARLVIEQYVSSDVLLADLKLMREQNRVESWVAACLFHPRRLPHAERDSFNLAFRTLMADLPATWTKLFYQASVTELVQEAFARGLALPALPLDEQRLRAWAYQAAPPQVWEPGRKVSDIALQYKQLRRRYHYYKIMSKLTWGKKKKHYKARRQAYKNELRHIRLFFANTRREWGL